MRPTGEALLLIGTESDAPGLAQVAAMLGLVLRVAAYPCTLADLGEQSHTLAAQGAQRVVVVPCELGADTQTLLVAKVAAARAALPGIELLLADPLLSPAGIAALAAQRYREALGLPIARESGHGQARPTAWATLPPRYQGGIEVSATPMAAAPLHYDAEGRVAWERMWGADDPTSPFCALALAGGPPHRGALLEPATPEEVAAQPERYRYVVAELERAAALVTGLEAAPNPAPGWIGVICPSQAAALWLLRAVLVENICARREGTTLLLPAGPAYRLEHEIRNVVTALAKTWHYWQEHCYQELPAVKPPST